MIEIHNGNLFDAPDGIICHQVNCKGVMGRGVAKIFKEKYPLTFKVYSSLCHDYNSEELLGNIILRAELDGKWTCCMFAQDDWCGQGCKTDYAAFEKCCDAIKRKIDALHLGRDKIINMPYRIGAGLGGGDWHFIYHILEEYFENYNLILWKLN